MTNIHSVTARLDRTRARLRNAALDLFLAQGYDATTVDQIAAAAGVSQMTFFRHFPTKESALMDDPYDPVIGELVAAQPKELGGVERTRRGLLLAWEQVADAAEAPTRSSIRLIANHDRLRGGFWANMRATETVLVDALVSTGTPRAEALVAAGACLGALTTVLLDWAVDDADADLGPRIVAALDLLATS